MKSDEIEQIWIDVEKKSNSETKTYQRMICVDLLFRAYIGAEGIPAKRFISLEIPYNDTKQFDAFIIPQGFSLYISEPGIKHDGFAACVLESASADQNDVFTIVVKDILHTLSKQRHAEKYVSELRLRIEKWRQFFKNPIRKKLSDDAVIGLMGELTLIDELMDCGIQGASELWNGPIKAAQDFHGENVAIEVKTAVTNKLEYVHISSEEQLDACNWKNLFLIAYRAERNDATGIKLPDMIKKIEGRISESQKSRLRACLICLGYEFGNEEAYTKGYTIKERKIYQVCDEFPNLTRHDLPKGIMDIKYKLSLSCCEKNMVDISTVINALKENEYGQS